MFKYVWLIILGIVVVAFLAYTVYCCYQASKDAESLEEWYDNMGMDYEWLISTWAVIFIITAMILFISSLIAFTSSMG